jgi:flagellar basal-body rod protein FlgB
MFDKLYAQNTILGTAAQASLLRNDIIVNNIANADTPGFKAKRVDFEKQFKEALRGFSPDTKQGLDLSGVSAFVRLHNPTHNYRIDRNNVDVEIEMVDLYQNSIRYDTLMNCIQSNSRRLSLVLSGGRQ